MVECFHSSKLLFVYRLLYEHHLAPREVVLTHWGRVTHICIGNLVIISSDYGLWPGRRQAIIWTNAGILLIGPLGTNFSEILIERLTISFEKMRLKVSSAKWWPFCLGLTVLILHVLDILHHVARNLIINPNGNIDCQPICIAIFNDQIIQGVYIWTLFYWMHFKRIHAEINWKLNVIGSASKKQLLINFQLKNRCELMDIC